MNFTEITSNNNWFKQHPEKIAGVEIETTSVKFPFQVKGTKEDVLRVTGMGKKSTQSTQLNKKPNVKNQAIFKPYFKHGVFDGYNVDFNGKKYFLSVDADWGKVYGISLENEDRIYSLSNRKVNKIWKELEKPFNLYLENEKKSKRIRIAKAKAKAIKIKLLLNESL